MAETQTLPALVRAKYPGQYDDLSDAELDAKVRAKFPGTYDDIPKPPQSAAATSVQEGFGKRMANAVGPTIRGLGQIGVPFTNIDINHTLEATGLVPEGRLTGAEANPRDQATRGAAGFAGNVAMGSKVISGVAQTARDAFAANAARAAEAANAAARAEKTARFVETGIIDASPDVVASPQAASSLGSKVVKAGVGLGLRAIGVPKPAVELFQAAMSSGVTPAQAAATAAKGDIKLFGALMTAYMQSRQVK